MRKWTTVFSALVFAGTAAQADLLGLRNLKSDVSFEIKGISADNETAFTAANDHRGDTVTRIRVGVSAEADGGIKGKMEVVRNPGTAADATYGNAGRPSSLDNYGTNNAIHNAYVDIADLLGLDNARLGRQYAGRQGDAIVYYGPVDDDAFTVTSLDALSISRKFDWLNVNGTTGKVVRTAATGAGDTNASWVTLSTDELVKTGDINVPLEVGYYHRVIQNAVTSSDDDNLTILDLRGGVHALDNKFWAGLEYAQDMGQVNTGAATKRDYDGSVVLAKVSYKDKENGFGVYAKMSNASGDDNGADTKDESFRAIASDYRYGEIFSNDNTFGGANGIVAGLDQGAQHLGSEIIQIGGHYVIPAWDNKFTAHGSYTTIKTAEAAAPGASKDVGNELDLSVAFNHNKNVSGALGFATFTPDDGLTGGAGAPDDAVMKWWAKMMVKWGGGA
jgi:hypothetical protein